MQFRHITSQDEAFLFELYASTRYEELSNWGWDENTTQTFLRMQWAAQTQSYGAQFPDLRQELVLVQGQRAGRILSCFTDDALLLVDISLLPEFRGKGYGTDVLGRILREAHENGVPVHLTVRQDNRAKRLYERLGFQSVGKVGADIRMEWRSDNAGKEKQRYEQERRDEEE